MVRTKSDERTAVTTVTYYDLSKPDMEVRANLAFKTIDDALQQNCDVVVVDGGSTDAFVQTIRSLGAIVLKEEARGISKSQQQAIRYAREKINPNSYILIEPEKAGLLKDYFGQITNPVYSRQADIVLVGRTEESMQSLTRAQRLTETKINQVLSGLLKMDGDFCMAPRVWNREATEHFLNYGPQKNWDLFHGPIIDAMTVGKVVRPVRIPYVYPREMIAQEEGVEMYEMKRINQLIEVTDFVREYLAKTATK